MNIIIIGYGRVGASLAKLVTTPTNNVTVIDIDPEVLARIDTDFPGHVVLGTGYDEDVLVQAGIEECDALAAVTNSDNVNLMATEVARQLYSVPHVITRLINPNRLDVYSQLGLDYVCDTEIVAEDIFAKIRSRRLHHLDTFGDYEIMDFSLEAPNGMRLEEIESLGDIRVMLVQHKDEVFKPSRSTVLRDGDVVMAVVHNKSVHDLEPFMRG